MPDIVLFDSHEADYDEYQTPEEKCVTGRPTQRIWNHFSSEDGRFYSGIWEAEPGCWRIEYTENEFCQILSGRSVLRSSGGPEVEVTAGDNFVIPAGFDGEWEVIETTRKLYAIYEPWPLSRGS